MTSIIALVLSLCALFIAVVGAFLAITAIRRAGSPQPQRDGRAADAIRREALLDQRSCMQAALRALASHFEIETPESRRDAQRVVRILSATPWLVASPVLADFELARIEGSITAGTVWVITGSADIEFELGAGFSTVVLTNLERGVKYRYLVPSNKSTIQRAAAIMREHPGIEIRFLDASLWERASETVDEFVVYDTEDAAARSYYSFPGSDPKDWIQADASSAVARLRDAQQAWQLAPTDMTGKDPRSL